jgi:alpha-galactosidase
MMKRVEWATWLVGLILLCSSANARANDTDILTPPSPSTPRINGPTVFGVRPGSPLLYTIPATGDRPMTFSADGLPAGVTLDGATGRFSGALAQAGDYPLTLHARNAKGAAEKKFRLIVGEGIALTPPMGWNSWNCWSDKVDEGKVLSSAQALVSSGLINHGWSYVNIDDTWQAPRGGPLHALQGNEKFPDLGRLCEKIHAMGLKAGIYSTPWMTSYAGYPGGSSADPSGAWTKSGPHGKLGAYAFETNDAKQFAAWGFDYLKYDWDPNDVPHTEAMSRALRASGRDIILSLSNSAPFEHAADWARLAQCWRTTGDIRDRWAASAEKWMYGVSEIGFSQDRWAAYAGPGHWNDPDMLVVGEVGWGAPHPSKLTPDEQYSHISLWCLLSAPLLIGADLSKLDPFTLNLLTNDEVLALDQDALGRQATRAATWSSVDIYLKPLEDGSTALGFFNRDSQPQNFTYTKLVRLGLEGKQHVRDLWRQTDLPDVDGAITVKINPHGVVLLKLTPVAGKVASRN